MVYSGARVCCPVTAGLKKQQRAQSDDEIPCHQQGARRDDDVAGMRIHCRNSRGLQNASLHGAVTARRRMSFPGFHEGQFSKGRLLISIDPLRNRTVSMECRLRKST